jgi:hypothetical protein
MQKRAANHQHKHFRSTGSAIIWPLGLEERYGISPSTRRRWEEQGVIPARDVFIGGEPKGWRPGTLDAADAGGKAQVA